MPILIRSRKSWGAAPPKNTPQQVDWTGTTLFVHHTGLEFRYVNDSRAARIREECAHMRKLQQIAFGRGFSDISYNYIIFPSGRTYRGRGGEVRGAHTQGGKPGYAAWYNEHPGVSFPGNYEHQKLTKRQVASLTALRYFLRTRFRIGKALWPHRKVHATACPGKNVMATLKLPS